MCNQTVILYIRGILDAHVTLAEFCPKLKHSNQFDIQKCFGSISYETLSVFEKTK